MAHRWQFFRAGGVDQVALLGAADLEHLAELDQKLWVALSMPTAGVDVDPRTLAHLDTDADGRIRPPELLAAVKWTIATLAKTSLLLEPKDSVALADIRDPAVLASARRILADLGRPDADAVTLADLDERAKTFEQARFNGDGIVTPATAGDDATKKAIEEILASVGGVPDRGQQGIGQAQLDQFFTEAQALCDWHGRGAAAGAFALGERSEAAGAALLAVRAKVEDFFARCRIAAIDPRAQANLAGTEADYAALTSETLGASSPAVAALPLSMVAPGAPLQLAAGANPAWVAALATFTTEVVTPILGARTSLTEAEWREILGRFSAFDAWMAEKPPTKVEALGVPRLRELLGAPREEVGKLVSADAAIEAEVKGASEVDKLVHFRRDLVKVLNNYVSFSDFYRRKGAAFQAGRLYLDARGCDLCVEVADAAKHATLAASSGVYLAYCEVTRAGLPKKTIVAGFTGGDSYNLLVGRNGVFYDRQGRDWDATITKIIANPISVREAFWSPYRKFVRMIEEQIAKRAASAESDTTAQMTIAATSVTQADKPADAKAPPPPKKSIDVGTVAALGVALGSIGTFLGLILGKFVDLGMWMPLGILGLMMLISGPSVLLAYLKLRQRNLGPILDGAGWAINTKAMMNVPFGTALTDLASLPPGASRNMSDPFAQKRRPWGLYVVLAILVAAGALWMLGKLDAYLPESVRHAKIFRPSAAPPAPPAPPAAPK